MLVQIGRQTSFNVVEEKKIYDSALNLIVYKIMVSLKG